MPLTANRLMGRNEAGERMVATDWTPVETWDTLAETCRRFLHKGSRKGMVGSLHRHGLQGAV